MLGEAPFPESGAAGMRGQCETAPWGEQAVSPQPCGSHTAPGEIFAAEGFLQQLELKRHEQGLGSLPAARGRLREDACCRRGALCPSL